MNRTRIGEEFKARFQRYEEWNDAIFNEFYGPSMKGKNTYLSLTEEELHIIQPPIAGPSVDPLVDFVDSVKRTLSLSGRRSLLDFHRWNARRWENDGFNRPPPYVGVLGLFCLAAAHQGVEETYAGNDFYGPLCELLGIRTVLGKQRLIRHFHNTQKSLWLSLNNYLDLHMNGALGKSTAVPIGRFNQIGYPVSQIRLLENDRSKLTQLFALNQFNPGQIIDPEDMLTFLDAWIPGSNVSNQAKASWFKAVEEDDHRHEIAYIASQELRNWDGLLNEETGGRVTPLLLTAGVEDFFGEPEFEFALSISENTAISDGTYQCQQPSNGLQMESGGYKKDFKQEGNGTELLTEFLLGVKIDNVLDNQIVFAHSENTGYRIEWQSKDILVLNWDDGQKKYTSSPKLELGLDAMVIVTKKYKLDSVSRALRESGSKHDIYGNDTIELLPSHWDVLWPVSVTSRPIGNSTSAIVPLATNTSLIIDGGFKLPGANQWLHSSPPTLKVSDPTGADIRSYSLKIAGIDELVWFDQSDDQEAKLNLSELNLDVGTYAIEVRRKDSDTPLTQRSLALLSAFDDSTEIDSTRVNHLTTIGLGMISASTIEGTAASSSGLIVEGGSVASTGTQNRTPKQFPELDIKQPPQTEGESNEPSVNKASDVRPKSMKSKTPVTKEFLTLRDKISQQDSQIQLTKALRIFLEKSLTRSLNLPYPNNLGQTKFSSSDYQKLAEIILQEKYTHVETRLDLEKSRDLIYRSLEAAELEGSEAEEQLAQWLTDA